MKNKLFEVIEMWGRKAFENRSLYEQHTWFGLSLWPYETVHVYKNVRVASLFKSLFEQMYNGLVIFFCRVCAYVSYTFTSNDRLVLGFWVV